MLHDLIYAIITIVIVLSFHLHYKYTSIRFAKFKEKHTREGIIEGLSLAKYAIALDASSIVAIDEELAKQEHDLVWFLHNSGLKRLV